MSEKQRVLTMSSGLLTAAPVGLATEAVETTLPGTVGWTDGLPYGACEALLKLPGPGWPVPDGQYCCWKWIELQKGQEQNII